MAICNFAIFFVAKAVITGFDSQLFVALSRADFITRACFIGARLPALAGITDTQTEFDQCRKLMIRPAAVFLFVPKVCLKNSRPLEDRRMSPAQSVRAWRLLNHLA